MKPKKISRHPRILTSSTGRIKICRADGDKASFPSAERGQSPHEHRRTVPGNGRGATRTGQSGGKGGKLYFCLYRFHEWPDYTLFWIPIDFIEKISVPVRCIVREFIRRFIRHHGLNMVKETWYYELALEELRDWKERDPDASPQEIRQNNLLAESYETGKISKALKRMEGKPFCVRLEDKIRECRTEAKRERELLGLVSEGLELITPDNPCLIQYYYDWAYEKEPNFPPIGLDTQIMLAYSNNDMLAENMESYFNSDCRETYAITPVTYMYLTPETDRLFRMDDYPERLSKWMQRFMQHITGSF
mgnify:CR=1 FL=1